MPLNPLPGDLLTTCAGQMSGPLEPGLLANLNHDLSTGLFCIIRQEDWIRSRISPLIQGSSAILNLDTTTSAAMIFQEPGMYVPAIYSGHVYWPLSFTSQTFATRFQRAMSTRSPQSHRWRCKCSRLRDHSLLPVPGWLVLPRHNQSGGNAVRR